ncbi:MAG: CPBP family intramembrane metalloprotease [Lachnospiraceae bacterium]|nr:CPBP family intramembrane metalloprotease [Lachnospiraceae bacterium]
MDKLVWLKEKHVLYFVLLLIIIQQFLTKGILIVLSYLGINIKGTNFDYMWSETIILVVAVFLTYVTKQTHVLRCGFKGFWKSLWSGMVFFLLAVPGCVLFATMATEEGATYKALPEILAFVLFVLLVGLAEEIFFRGILADAILKRFGNSVSGVVISVVLSGVVFGLAHILNILSGQSLEESIVQVVATSMLGILLSAIYIRHRNAYAVALLHTVLDFMTMFSSGFFQGESIGDVATDIDFWASLKQALISQSIFIIVALWVLRPKVLRKIVNHLNQEKIS